MYPKLVGLLDQIATRVASVIADGADHGDETVYDAVTNRHPEADIIIRFCHPSRLGDLAGRTSAGL